MSVDEFLALEETKPYSELIDGRVVQKAGGDPVHSALVVELIFALGNYLAHSREGRVDTELTHLERASEWVFLPDISVTLRGRRPPPRDELGRALEVLPDFAIEVLSPEDRPGRTARRITDYLRAGTRLLWIVDPEGEVVTIWEQGREPRLARAPEIISARPVLAGFEVDLAALLGSLSEE